MYRKQHWCTTAQQPHLLAIGKLVTIYIKIFFLFLWLCSISCVSVQIKFGFICHLHYCSFYLTCFHTHASIRVFFSKCRLIIPPHRLNFMRAKNFSLQFIISIESNSSINSNKKINYKVGGNSLMEEFSILWKFNSAERD